MFIITHIELYTFITVLVKVQWPISRPWELTKDLGNLIWLSSIYYLKLMSMVVLLIFYNPHNHSHSLEACCGQILKHKAIKEKHNMSPRSSCGLIQVSGTHWNLSQNGHFNTMFPEIMSTKAFYPGALTSMVHRFSCYLNSPYLREQVAPG